MTTFTRLRSWRTRTALKGIRERWPLKWWARFARQFWREVHRMHFDIDLRVRRMVSRHGEAGAVRAMARGHNAALERSRTELEAMRREMMAKVGA